MKYLSFFILTGVLFGFKSAIKNEVPSSERISKNILSENLNINKNLLVNSKEDLKGFWIYDYDEYEEEKYYGKFIFIFEKIDNDKLFAHILKEEKIEPVIFNLIENKKCFNLNSEENIKDFPFKKWHLQINKGTNILQGKITALDFNEENREYLIELQKKNHIYDPKNLIETMFVDNDKTGMGYREYGNEFDKEVIIVKDDEKSEEFAKKASKEKENKKPKMIKRIEREGYYSTTDAIYKINPSTNILKNELVESLTKADLYILRNSIFAKHGLIFNDPKLRSYFINQSWYLPVSNDVSSNITSIEKKNIELIERYEQNAKEYFRVFGR